MIQLPFCKPYKTAATIHCPLLLIAPEDDILCPVEGCEIISRAAPHNVELLRLLDSGHFDIYPGKKDYRKGIETQLQFLKNHVR
ncbi:hypothetical protein PM082_007634 [Marasmius tenuissimus]|nr:hypothetical protein PM082_007634 [Marasmius tenuissimus]